MCGACPGTTDGAAGRVDSGDVLILCVGNLLAGDDGVGVHVAHALGRDRPQSGTRVVDGGTLGLDLLSLLEGTVGLVIVDAADLGARPGTVRRLSGAELSSVLDRHLSAHQIGVSDLLALGSLTGWLPPRVEMVAIQPGPITGLTMELSAEAAEAVPIAADEARAAAASMAAVGG